jgi:hypothetical protein
MGYIYKVNTYGYKVDWWDWQSGSRNRWCNVEDGVATYMSIFDQPVNSEMGCSLIDICSISVPFLPNCIVKPFISFTPSVSGTTLSVPSVYFISICIYFIDVPHVHPTKYSKPYMTHNKKQSGSVAKTKWISGQNTRTIFQIWLKTASNLEWIWEVIDSCCLEYI